MSTPAQRFSCCRFNHHSFRLQTSYSKALFLSVRHYATPQPQSQPTPYRSTATPLIKTTQSPSKLIKPKSPPSKLQPSNHSPTPSSAILNPPPTTRPPPLTLPTKIPSDPAYKYYYHLGKAYLTFYKTGLKSIYANYKSAHSIPNLTSSPLWSPRLSLYIAATTPTTTNNRQPLTRSQLQLLLRLRADAKVLPAFILLFMICGEFTPLLVPFLTAIVPPTVHIPAQTKKLREKVEKRRQDARLEGPEEWRRVRNLWGMANPVLLTPGMQAEMGLTRVRVMRRLASELGVYPGWVERIPSEAVGMRVVRWRLEGRLEEVGTDDTMIVRDGGVQGLVAEEVAMACERRGLGVLGKTEGEMRAELGGWLKEGGRIM